MESGLVCLPPIANSHIERVIRASCLAVSKTLFILVKDDACTTTRQIVDCLGLWYDIVANVKPRLNVVPLFRFAGWTNDALATMPGLEAFLTQPSFKNEDSIILDDLNLDRSKSGLDPIRMHALDIQEHNELDEQSTENVEGKDSTHENESLVFNRVAVGGTFDRLHAGHRLLLAVTALVARESIFIGVTGDRLLANKAHKEILEPYDDRCNTAVAFMKSVRRGIVVEAGPLLDPKEPTVAETDEGVEALVISQETVTGGEAINEGRIKRGFKPLTLVTVGLVGGKGDPEQKLSSSALRELDSKPV